MNTNICVMKPCYNLHLVKSQTRFTIVSRIAVGIAASFLKLSLTSTKFTNKFCIDYSFVLFSETQLLLRLTQIRRSRYAWVVFSLLFLERKDFIQYF